MNEQYKPSLWCRIFGHQFSSGWMDDYRENPSTGRWEEISKKVTISHCRRCGIPNPAFVPDDPES